MGESGEICGGKEVCVKPKMWEWVLSSEAGYGQFHQAFLLSQANPDDRLSLAEHPNQKVSASVRSVVPETKVHGLALEVSTLDGVLSAPHTLGEQILSRRTPRRLSLSLRSQEGITPKLLHPEGR
ncbi:hypothetical protein DPEC_G00223490 [Dallia pectoralis]|uniref:Uncharacterized protein n=1 Tax=Dallia pectoralis TaxID=75939 RepID=A0ACC2FZT1_DALPE|nr:hypothetical protein DPEC_G00223490 [Dallia pectoralis]